MTATEGLFCIALPLARTCFSRLTVPDTEVGGVFDGAEEAGRVIGPHLQCSQRNRGTGRPAKDLETVEERGEDQFRALRLILGGSKAHAQDVTLQLLQAALGIHTHATTRFFLVRGEADLEFAINRVMNK